MNDASLVEPQPDIDTLDPRGRVLMIDDDVDQTDALAYRLRHQGFDVKTTVSGEVGQRLAQEWKPDLILLDIRLPDANGLELCSQLSDDPLTAAIPVLLVSGAEIGHIVRNARAVGSRFYLRKPYDPNVLLVLIQQALESSSDL